MNKTPRSNGQTSAIGRAAIYIVVLLGGIQLIASAMLIHSGIDGYRSASEHEMLNRDNQGLFMAAQALARESNQTMTLLSGVRAPAAVELERLQPLRRETDLLLARALATPREDATTAALLAEVGAKRDSLKQHRKDIDSVLRRQPFQLDENASYGWRLFVASLYGSLDKALRRDSFNLGDESDPRLNRMAEVKFDIWSLSRVLNEEAHALSLRARFQRKLNSTDEYQLMRDRERTQLIMERLRESVQYLDHSKLEQRLRQLNSSILSLNRQTDLQLALLESGKGAQLVTGDHLTLWGRLGTQLDDYFATLSDLTHQTVQDYMRSYQLGLLFNGSFALLSMCLYLFLLLRMRKQILHPLRRLQRLLDAAADAILTVDEQRRVVVANHGAERMFGRSKEELGQLPIGELLIIDSQDSDWMESRDGLDHSLPGRGMHADGSIFYAGVAISPLSDKEGGSDHYLLIVRNEQERRVAEASLARSLQLLSGIHRVEGLLFARSPRHSVYAEILRILLDYFRLDSGLILALETGRDKTASFHVQASRGIASAPAWVEAFRRQPQAQAMQLGAQQHIVREDGWVYIPVEIDARTVLVAGLQDCHLDEDQYLALQPLLGTCGSIVGFYAEEDRRRNSERHLREVLQQEEAIYSASPVGLLRVTCDYAIVRANRTAERLFGAGPDSLQGLHLQEVLATEGEWLALMRQLDEARQHDRPLHAEIECLQVGGRPVWVMFTGQLLFPGMVNHDMILACMDVSDRRAAEEGLLRARDEAAEARSQLVVAIESLEEAFAFFDVHDKLVQCNQRFADLVGHGYQPEQLRGRTFEALVRGALDEGEHPEAGFSHPEWVAERLRRHASGSAAFQLRVGERWFQVSDHATPGGGSVCIHADITSLKRQEGDLLLARDLAEQANRAKSAFLATMSHEIRTPMNGVLGMLELLSLTRLEAEQQETVEAIQDSARTLLRLIDDILDFSKIEAGKLDITPEPAAIPDVMHKVHQLYAEMAANKQLSFRLDIDPQVAPALLVDPLRLRQILQNFCSNALKFTHQGEVVLRVRCLADLPTHQQLRFEVQDTGIGISRENLTRLFQPFTQAENSTARRFGGTGLGLVICRRLAVLMQGEVGMSSKEGEGTLASLELDLPKADQADIRTAPLEITPVALASSRQQIAANLLPVLFVEDNPTNRKLTLKQFELLGYPVEAAENGVEAVNKWQKGEYSLILTDCHMPEMDGYELARTIRYYESTVFDARRIPIIACTANASREEVEKTSAAGMDDFMTKPLSLGTLKAMLEKWMTQANEEALQAQETHNLPAAADDGAQQQFASAMPIDRSVLEVYSGGDWMMERAILDEFLLANDDDVAVLQKAVSERDAERVAWSAHRIKGASRMVGALMLGDAAELLEKAGKAGELATIDTEWPGFVQTLAVLKAWLETQPTA
ncbi:MAG: ATP-binding protein [Vogesella sp.]|uniref:ATP-binding protein n=1 Tax=Vogesella sp. TaxID=1904252 RepID=UPI00391A23C5